MKFFPSNSTIGDVESTFRNKLVLLSIPSEGSVGQLAIDIILSALDKSSKLVREGSFESFDLLPVLGVDRLSSTSAKFVCMPVEVYSVESSSCVIIQQRSACIKGKLQSFSKALKDLLTSFGIERLVILCGASPCDLFESAMKGDRLFSSVSQSDNDIKSFIGSYPELQSLLENSYEIQPTSDGWNEVRGMPLAKTIARVDRSEGNFPVYLLGKFCSDGNNANDGINLARAVSIALGIIEIKYFEDTERISRPESWSKLFGADIHTSSSSASIYW